MDCHQLHLLLLKKVSCERVDNRESLAVKGSFCCFPANTYKAPPCSVYLHQALQHNIWYEIRRGDVPTTRRPNSEKNFRASYNDQDPELGAHCRASREFTAKVKLRAVQGLAKASPPTRIGSIH
jgi:hypothetical protein